MSDAPPRGTLATIARHLALAVQPLRDAVASEGAFKAFMYRLGWKVESLPPAYVALGGLVDDAATALAAIEASPDDPDLEAVLELLGKVRAIHQAIKGLTDAPAGVDATAFLQEIGERLLELLLVDYVAAALPGTYHALATVGVIAIEVAGEGADRPPRVRSHLRFDRVRDILADPASLPRFAYGWGEDDLDTTTLFAHLRELLDHTGALVSFGWAPADLVDGYVGPSAPRGALKLTALETTVADRPVELALLLLPLPAEADAKPGIILQPAVPDLGAERDLGGGLRLRIRPAADLSQLFGIEIRPPGDISVRYPFAPGTELPPVGFGVALEYAPETPTLLVGRSGASRLVMQGAGASLDLDRREGALELRVGLAVNGLTLVLAAADQDSFLHELIGDRDATIPIALGLTWSSRTGVAFVGGAGFEVSTLPSVTIGPITIQELRLAIRTTLDSTRPPDAIVEVGASLGGRVGPIAFSTQNAGIRLKAVFEDGNAGPFDVSVAFKPPDGMGLVVDAGPVTGGGFLGYEEATGRYVGALELEVYDIAVKAFGVLDTRLPGGQPAYSFLIIVSAEFTPIPLGFGFTLNGVGGLAGIHRRVALDAFRQRLGQGTLDHILFPANPVQDAPRIVSDLQTLMPPTANRYVFGPMALIGWGPAGLLEGKLAVLLELPDPVRLALLGQFRLDLPRKDAALVTLHLDVAGELDFARQRLAIDGRLHDSQVVGFPIEGELAARIVGGPDPGFALSIGGFNPAFHPPAGFPTLQRITVPIGLDDDPRVTLEGYLALTSNTLQVGALATLYASAGWFNVTGHVGFNGLFTFLPFSFLTDFSGKVALNKGDSQIAAIKLEAVISGPTPWHVSGEACLEIRWFPDICVGVHATFGPRASIDVPALDPFGPLRAAIESLESWAEARPPGVFRAATRAAPADASTRALLDPAAGITLRQSVVPLARQITRFGGAPPLGGPTRFDIQTVTLAGAGASFAPVQDLFAPAQFEDLGDDDKLSRPDFERMDAGLTLGGDAVALGSPVGAGLQYETRILDSAFESRPGNDYHPRNDLLIAATALGFAAWSPLRASGPSKFAPPPVRPALAALAEERFVVASTIDLSERRDIALPAAKGAVFQALAAHLAAHPEDRGRLDVVSVDELVGAA